MSMRGGVRGIPFFLLFSSTFLLFYSVTVRNLSGCDPHIVKLQQFGWCCGLEGDWRGQGSTGDDDDDSQRSF